MENENISYKGHTFVEISNHSTHHYIYNISAFWTKFKCIKCGVCDYYSEGYYYNPYTEREEKIGWRYFDSPFCRRTLEVNRDDFRLCSEICMDLALH